MFKKTQHDNEYSLNFLSMDNVEQSKSPCDLIMIIGQDSETRLLLKTLLEIWDYQTIEVSNVQEAKNVAHFFKPRLIIMDTTASLKQTFGDLRELRQTKDFSELCLLVISGYPQNEIREATLSNGADGFLVKPLNFKKMETSVKTFMTKNDLSSEKI